MKKTHAQIDAVRLMRTLRDSLGTQVGNMTFEQEHRFISERLRSPRPKASKAR